MWGLEYDHYNLGSTLEELNDLVSCGNDYFALNVTNCTSGSNCWELMSLTSYTPPGCAPQTEVETKVKNL